MKLLTPTETISNKDLQLATGLSRIATLDKELIKKRKELETINSDIDKAIEAQVAILEKAKEKSSYFNEIKKLEEEIKKLEERRRESLIPITEKWKEIEKAEVIIREKEIAIQKKGDIFDENLEALEEKLTEVAIREKTAEELNQKQSLAQEGIELQKTQIDKKSKELNELTIKYFSELEVKARELSTNKSKLELKERNLLDKEQSIDIKEKGFIDRERQLQDKYATLERTLNRLNVKI